MKRLLALPVFLLAFTLPLISGGILNRDVIPPGTEIRIRTDRPVDVATWDRGRIYPSYVGTDVYDSDGNVVIPRGARSELIVRQVGPGELALDLESITVDGRRYVMDARGPEFNMDGEQYNSGAGIIGNIVDAITGTGNAQPEYRGNQIRIPPGSELTFQLQQPLRIAGWGDEGYSNRGYHYHHETNHGWYR